MKVILSRKGFDSSNGGFPSLILPNNEMIMLPIPRDKDHFKYSNIIPNTSYGDYKNLELYNIMNRLYDNNNVKIPLPEVSHCHLDPYLGNYSDSLKETKDWKGIFGQEGAAATHLSNNGVKKGDIFIFFGWFDNVNKNKAGNYQYDNYVKGKKEGRHTMFGYLQVGDIIRSENNNNYNKYKKIYEKHPHFYCDRKDPNIIYIPYEKLNDSEESNIAGYGMFKYDSELDLTQQKPDKTYWNRTRWSCDNLPACLKELTVSHLKYECKDNYFQSARRGQEFVIEDNKEVEKWAIELIKKHSVNRIK